MTDRSAGGPASTGPPSGDRPSSGEDRIVVRDKRKVTAADSKADPPATKQAKPAPTKPAPAKPAKPASPQADKPAKPAADAAAKPEEKPTAEVEAEPIEGEVVETTAEAEKDEAEPAEDKHPLGAELEALRAELEERTRDLQRVGAEYANYRKRVDRDRGVVAEQALGSVLASLLPVLDDLDRARDHGDLVGPFASVAEQLTGALSKYGLTPFGEKGDPFDPARHEAVAHLTSAEVSEPTCIDVLRRGYLLGDRLLRPALVAVADPESE